MAIEKLLVRRALCVVWAVNGPYLHLARNDDSLAHPQCRATERCLHGKREETLGPNMLAPVLFRRLLVAETSLRDTPPTVSTRCQNSCAPQPGVMPINTYGTRPGWPTCDVSRRADC